MTAVKGAKEAFTTPAADGTPGKPSPTLSSAIKVGKRLYVSGILGNNADNKGNVEAQTKEALARIERTLKAAGFGWTDLVDGVVYITDVSNFQGDEQRLSPGARQGLPRPRDGQDRPRRRGRASSRSCSSRRSRSGIGLTGYGLLELRSVHEPAARSPQAHRSAAPVLASRDGRHCPRLGQDSVGLPSQPLHRNHP